jgi:hypothetical protein
VVEMGTFLMSLILLEPLFVRASDQPVAKWVVIARREFARPWPVSESATIAHVVRSC